MVGERIDSYLVERLLAQGGFATLYGGRDAADQEVAIKVLRAEHLGSAAVKRFTQEIAIVERLQHPNIARVVAAGQLGDGRPYCVMELLRGEDLAAALGHRRFPVAEAIDLLGALGDALTAAHAAGVIHRDVTPTNVFLCEDGRVVLLDFGIAKLVATDARITTSRQAIGTIGSMAPEQLITSEVDARADVYALGVLAFHLLAGAPPFEGEQAAMLHRFAQRPRPSSLGAPAVFDAVVTRAMAIRVADRYATAAELVAALRVAGREASRSSKPGSS